MKTMILKATTTKSNVFHLEDLVNRIHVIYSGSYKERIAILDYMEIMLQDELKAFATSTTKEELESLYISLKNDIYSIYKMGGVEIDILFKLGFTIKYFLNMRNDDLGLIIITQHKKI